MVREELRFNKGGQWELVKTKANDYPPGLDYMSYRNPDLQGYLPKDLGTKGSLHNVSNTRPPRTTGKKKMEAKVPMPVRSAFADRNPGKESL